MLRHTLIAGLFALPLLASGALAEDLSHYKSLQTPLLQAGETTLGQPIVYPVGAAKVTSATTTLPPGAETGWHSHEVPLFGYVLEGVLTIDYGSKGTKIFHAGQALDGSDELAPQRHQQGQGAGTLAGDLHGRRRQGQHGQDPRAVMTPIIIEQLTRDAFTPFGQVISTKGAHHYPINGGMTERYHDLAKIELGGPDPRPLLSLFRGQPYSLPLTLGMVERHPLGSQAFYPLSGRPFLVIVALDQHGVPRTPRAFLTTPGEGVNIAMNAWHGVLTPLEAPSDFLVVDRGGAGNNLEEFFFPEPYAVISVA